MLALLDAISPRPADAPSRGAGGWPEPAPPAAGFLAEGDGEPLAALSDDVLSPRFCSWRGASGRRYIVSVYDARACPAYCDAVLIAAAVGADGRRRALTLLDTGIFPESVVARATKSLSNFPERVEFHLHLLASSSAERQAVLEDLSAAAPYASRS
jgi:hypothetical protein